MEWAMIMVRAQYIGVGYKLGAYQWLKNLPNKRKYYSENMGTICLYWNTFPLNAISYDSANGFKHILSTINLFYTVYIFDLY